jgi:L-lactate dehydrogenase complex protein LldG
MSDARNAILERIRAQKAKAGDGSSQMSVKQWLGQRRRGPAPAWEFDRITRFLNQLERAAATFSRLASAGDVPRAVDDYRQSKVLGRTILCASTPRLKEIEWPQGWSVEYRPAQAKDRVVLSEAYLAIAETGSVVLCSGPETPTTLNFLTDHFICVVAQSRIVETIEDVWDRVREDGGGMPRAINFVTGPSRTADVEQTIQLGAHGPRHVHVLLLEE